MNPRNGKKAYRVESKKAGRSFFSLRIGVTGILSAAATIACAATLVSFLGEEWWPFELATSFRVQYAVALMAGGMIFLLLKNFWAAAVFILFAIPNVVSIVPFYVPRQSPPTVGHSLKAVFMNLSVTSTDYGKASDFVRLHNPDLIAVVEAGEVWATNLRRRLRDYPHVVFRTRDDEFGIGLLSKIPLENAVITDLGDWGFPAIKASVRMWDRSLTVFVVHPPPPVTGLFREERMRQINRLAALVKKERHVIIMGDLNLTPWSPIFRDLMSRTGLKDGRKGFGIQPTWPTTIPWLLIPIDHCLISGDLVVREFSAGASIGSDHYPLVLKLGPREGLPTIGVIVDG